MNKLLLLIALSFICNSAFSQKYYEALVIKKTEDTVKGKIMLFRGVMDGLVGIKEAYYYGRNITLTNERKRSIAHIKPIDVQELYITYSPTYKQRWVSRGNSLVMIYHEGKRIRWIKYYDSMPDGSPVQRDLLINANGRNYTLNRLNYRNGFSALTADKPELAEEIDTLDFDFTKFLELIQKYDNL